MRNFQEKHVTRSAGVLPHTPYDTGLRRVSISSPLIFATTIHCYIITIIMQSRHSVAAATGTKIRAERSGVRIPAEARVFSPLNRPTLGSTEFPIQ
jgi:hypothetical protein